MGRLTVAVTGAPGSGKSTFSRMLGQMGATVVDADAEVHKLLRRPEVKEALKKAFGETPFTPEGEVDRKVLGRLAFASKESARRLTETLRPFILDHFRSLVAAHRRGILVLDAPMILEYGLGDAVDILVVVRAPRPLRLRRFSARTGYPLEVAEQVEALQWPEEEKARHAHFVVDNDQDLDHLRRRAEDLFRKLLRLSRERN